MEYSQTPTVDSNSNENYSLNPYSNGILTDVTFKENRSCRYVLILILMEYSQTLKNHNSMKKKSVLILILMEYSQTFCKSFGTGVSKGLNPYSNGILTDTIEQPSKHKLAYVLILILMEYSQTLY